MSAAVADRRPQTADRRLATPAQLKLVPKTGRKGARKLEDMAPAQQAAFATPEGFAMLCLGMDGKEGRPTLYPQQRAVLRDMTFDGSKVVFRCGNEVGKTSIIVCVLILWHCTVFPAQANGRKPAQAISTAGAWRQIEDQLIPNLKAHAFRFPRDWVFNASTIMVKGVPAYTGFSANDDRTAQGFHGEPTAPLLGIIDEAAGVDDTVAFAIEDRCNPQRVLVTGSPLGPEGFFYRNCTQLAHLYRQHRLTQPDCEHIKREAILRTIEKYDAAALAGENLDAPNWARIEARCKHPFVLSRVFGAFYHDVEGSILSLRDLERCFENPPAPRPGDRMGFIDFAAGGRAETVLALRVGNKAWLQKTWRGDPSDVVGHLVEELNQAQDRWGFKAEEIDADADGPGAVIIPTLRKHRWPVNEFHGGAKARYDGSYFNLISEVWIEGATKLRNREVIVERDAELQAQLTTRKWHRSSELLKRIESKDDLLKRGLPSPDRADALLGCLMPGRLTRSLNFAEQTERIPGTKLMLEPEHRASGVQVDESILASMGMGGGV